MRFLLLLIGSLSFSLFSNVAISDVQNKAIRFASFQYPIFLTPFKVSSMEDRVVSDLIFLKLFELDEQTYQFYPAVAEKLDVSKDRKTYTVILRKEAKFSDGSDVTAEDARYTFQRITDPKEMGIGLRSFYDGVDLKVLGPKKFQFIVKKPRFNHHTTFQFFRIVSKNSKDDLFQSIGTGPYRIGKTLSDQSVELLRIRPWWGDRVSKLQDQAKADRFEFKIVKDPYLQYELFKKGEIDALIARAEVYRERVLGTDQDLFQKRDGQKMIDSGSKKKVFWKDEVKSQGNVMWFGVGVNLKHTFLSEKNLRHALMHAIPWDQVLEKGYYGLASLARSPFGKEYESPSDPYPHDVKKSLAILKASGFQDSNGDGTLDKNGRELKFQFTYASSSQANRNIAQVLKESFAKVGIGLDLKGVDLPTLFQSYDQKNFDLIYMGWGGALKPIDPKQNWHSSSIPAGNNGTSYANAIVDQWIDEANAEMDLKKRDRILKKISDQILDDLPYLFLGRKDVITPIISPKVDAPVWVQKFGVDLARPYYKIAL